MGRFVSDYEFRSPILLVANLFSHTNDPARAGHLDFDGVGFDEVDEEGAHERDDPG